MLSQFIGIITVSRDSSISAVAASADLHHCNHSPAWHWLQWKCWRSTGSAAGCVETAHASGLCKDIRVVMLWHSSLPLAFFICKRWFVIFIFKSLKPGLLFKCTTLHTVRPQDSESPREQLLYQHLILIVPSGDKCVGIPLKKEYFEQESVTPMGSAEFIFQFDCLKHAIKKQSNLLVQRGQEKQELFFN